MRIFCQFWKNKFKLMRVEKFLACPSNEFFCDQFLCRLRRHLKSHSLAISILNIYECHQQEKEFVIHNTKRCCQKLAINYNLMVAGSLIDDRYVLRLLNSFGTTFFPLVKDISRISFLIFFLLLSLSLVIFNFFLVVNSRLSSFILDTERFQKEETKQIEIDSSRM